jgi:hypothetical protein
MSSTEPEADTAAERSPTPATSSQTLSPAPADRGARDTNGGAAVSNELTLTPEHENAQCRGEHEAVRPETSDVLDTDTTPGPSAAIAEPGTDQQEAPCRPAAERASPVELSTGAASRPPLGRSRPKPTEAKPLPFMRRDLSAAAAKPRRRPARELATVTTRVPSAAVEEVAHVLPTPIPTPAQDPIPAVVSDDLTAGQSRRTHPEAEVRPDLERPWLAPLPRIVRLVDRKALNKRHGANPAPDGQRNTLDSRDLLLLTPQPMIASELAPFAKAPSAELALQSLRQIRPSILASLTPEPMRRWKQVGAPIEKGPPRASAAAIRVPRPVPFQGGFEELPRYYEQQMIDVGPLVTPQLGAIAVLRLQRLQAEADTATVTPSHGISSCPANDRRRRERALVTAADGATASLKPCTLNAAEYVPPNRRRLAPIRSMPKSFSGAPLLASANLSDFEAHALSLHAALAGPTRRRQPEAIGGCIPDDDPIAALKRSIPQAIRRHMKLPDSAAELEAKRAADAKMRRFRRETLARLRARDDDVDRIASEVHQKSVFEQVLKDRKQHELQAEAADAAT